MKISEILLLGKLANACPDGEFQLTGMKECRPYLTCEDFNDIKVRRKINSGMSKIILHAKWKGHSLAYSIPNIDFPDRIDDFHHNVEMLKKLQSRHVVKYVGQCEDAILTEFHEQGTLGDFVESSAVYKDLNLRERFELAHRYLEILAFLHDSPAGTRVMCDTNMVKGTVKQYLVTSDNDFVVNDLDDLRLVENGKMEGRICGHADFLFNRPDILGENFLAPEQRPSKSHRNIRDMPVLNEKIDIYKVPAITAYILGDVEGHNDIMDLLTPIHQACLKKDPSKRPSGKF
ncbi:Oidioi.mRNA.OKI2018_I69.PAR.g12121.t1.cds [Oikopleura dioica]|uniref:Oidioi.mRNA.OKI2018_I69.PAR.g12121.t1.cds n=1 Tax=Oikopleura dioica TaxID=34765 RepID=A0ABN7RZ65_OIKDI|nr:Oidioi.mRNA.OKI2018_I69.PAR.g12121.t1.cds [Oikopleura dioica]